MNGSQTRTKPEPLEITAEDLQRKIMMFVCKDGTVTYRPTGQPPFNGVALPVFSVNTKREAEAMRTIMCRMQYTAHPQLPGEPWYKLNHFNGTLEDLPRVIQMMKLVHAKDSMPNEEFWKQYGTLAAQDTPPEPEPEDVET